MKIDANIYIGGNSYPTFMRIEIDESEVAGMSETEKEIHIQQLVKDTVIDQLHIECMSKINPVPMTT